MQRLILCGLLVLAVGCSERREVKTTDSVAVPADSSVVGAEEHVVIPPLPPDTARPGILGDTTLTSTNGNREAPIVPGPKLQPLDEARRDPSLIAFREKLLSVVEHHDEATLMQMIGTPIHYSFGINEGLNGFRKNWGLDKNSVESDIWPVLEFVLRLGGKFDKSGNFWAPYYYINWPEDPSLDAFNYGAVTDQHVPMYALPSRKSQVLRGLNYDIVRLLQPLSNDKLPPHSPHLWRHVMTADGVKGYVSDDHLGSPVGYRAAFKNIKGKWRMTTLITGD